MKDNRSIVFMGSPDFASASLRSIYDAGIDIKAVVTQPDKERGRGRSVSFTDVKKTALELGLPVLQPNKLRDEVFISELRSLNADLFVVVAFRVLPSKVLGIPPLGSINLHASLLPEYRGAAPINHALFNGEKETGLTVFFLNKNIDTGDIVTQKVIAIDEEDDLGSLYNKLKVSGSVLLPGVVLDIFIGNYKLIPQDVSNVRHLEAPKIFTENCRIDWAWSQADIHNLVRGLSPRPGAFSYFSGKRIKLLKTQPAEDHGPDVLPGTVTEADSRKGVLRIKCGSGCLDILKIQPEGKAPMDAAPFMNGHNISKGSALGN